MRALRFVTSSEGGGYIVLEAVEGGEQFQVFIDAQLRDAVRSDLPRISPARPGPQPSLSPREIQVRVRGGEDPAQLATENGMSLERVLRFASAVLDERARMAEEARRARASRPSADGQSVIFGDAVDDRFTAHGIDPAGVAWDSRRGEDGQWVIVARWFGGNANRQAEWVFHTFARAVAPLDETAADLLSDRPIHPIHSVPSYDTGASIVAFPATPDAQTGPLPQREDLFDQSAYNTGLGLHVDTIIDDEDLGLALSGSDVFATPELPLGLDIPRSGSERSGAERTGSIPRVTNLGISHRGVGRDGDQATVRDLSDEARAERARIPSWDEILLGVRRKGD